MTTHTLEDKLLVNDMELVTLVANALKATEPGRDEATTHYGRSREIIQWLRAYFAEHMPEAHLLMRLYPQIPIRFTCAPRLPDGNQARARVGR